MNFDHRGDGDAGGSGSERNLIPALYAAPASLAFGFDEPVAQLGGEAAGHVLGTAALWRKGVGQEVLRTRRWRLGRLEARGAVESGGVLVPVLVLVLVRTNLRSAGIHAPRG